MTCQEQTENPNKILNKIWSANKGNQKERYTELKLKKIKNKTKNMKKWR